MRIGCPAFSRQTKGRTLSTTRQNGTKTVLPRTGPDHFWRLVREEYAGDDRRKWKYLAMLALRENAGWPLDRIGAVFGHPKGHVTRCLTNIKRELRERFQMSPDVLELPDDKHFEREPASDIHHTESQIQ